MPCPKKNEYCVGHDRRGNKCPSCLKRARKHQNPSRVQYVHRDHGDVVTVR